MRAWLRRKAVRAAELFAVAVAFTLAAAWAAGAAPISGCMTADELAVDLAKSHAKIIRAAVDPEREGNWLVLFEGDAGNGAVTVTLGAVGQDLRICWLEQATGANDAWLIAAVWHYRGKGPQA